MLFLIFALGLVIGSFLNVVIFRLPQQTVREDISINKPKRSFCPHCNTSLSVLELIPLLSFVWQKGQCKHCQNPIAWQYPLVEFSSAILSVLLVIYVGLNAATFLYLLLLYFLIPLFLIDAKHQLLPDVLTLPLLWLGLIFQINFGDLQSGVIGAMLGYLVLWGIYWGFKLITGREGMGYGDFKLTAAIGAWLGWQLLPSLFVIASILGLVFFLFKKDKNQQLAFGPFLIVAFVLLLEPNIINNLQNFAHFMGDFCIN